MDKNPNTEELLAALKRTTSCLAIWAADHASETTADIDATLYEARRAIASAEQAHAAKDSPTPEEAEPDAATAWHDGFLAGLGCQPWDNASDWAILTGQSYARGEVMPSMPWPVLRSHASDCAVHDVPAFEHGSCDCGAECHHHEAGCAPGREEIVSVLMSKLSAHETFDIGPQIEGHDEAADAILALWAKPERQGREQVIGELCGDDLLKECDHIYNVEDWETTFNADDLCELADSIELDSNTSGSVVEVGRLKAMPSIYAVNVAVEWDEQDGGPVDWEVKVFSSAKAAKDAYEASLQSPAALAKARSAAPKARGEA